VNVALDAGAAAATANAAGLDTNSTASQKLSASKAALELDLSQGKTAAIAGDTQDLTQATIDAACVTDQMAVAEQHANDAADAAALGVGSLGSAFVAFAHDAAKADEALKIADSFDAVNTAAAKVKTDQADIAGTSKNAADANKGEADALRGLSDANQSVSDSHQRLSDSYVALQDAQDRVKTSADGLLRAQQALDQYNSPRGAQERALQLDELQRTVATTPAGEDAKQLSLLQFQDQSVQQKQSLTDAVISGQRGVRDANKGVSDAQRGIADAERGIQDATIKVADAQQAVSDAVTKRRKVHDDAAASIAGDERKVGGAIVAVITEIEKAQKAHQLANGELGNYLKLLDDVAQVADPGGPLSKSLDSLVGKMELSAVLAQAAIDLVAAGAGPAGAIGPPVGLSPTGSSFPTPQQLGQSNAPSGPPGATGGVTFANTYHINAQGTPTQAELDYIARTQAWQLTRTGRR
jgi:hypothetical protein